MQTTTELKQWNDVMYLVTVYRDENIGLTLINYTSAEEIYRPLQRYHPLLDIYRLCSSCRLFIPVPFVQAG